MSIAGCSSASATREPAVVIPTGTAPASAGALSSKRKRCISTPSFSSRRTPRSTHANNALSAAARSMGPTRSIRSFTVQTSDQIRVSMVKSTSIRQGIIPCSEKSSINAASRGGTSALTVRSFNWISRRMLPRWDSQRSFLSGLNVANSRAYDS